MEKLNRERKPTPENISCMVDNKKCMCPHGKFHPLKYRKVKYFPERNYRDIEDIIFKTHI